ncbi:MAG: YIP1 family protein [Candidatus Aenigmarchaeota archaeon]|nr:YIP1 family protein [Candidatus Aenigmarchaeota archaeon]
MEIFRRSWGVISDPSRFFSKIKKEKGLKKAFTYFFVLSLFGTVMSFAANEMLLDYVYGPLMNAYGFSAPQQEVSQQIVGTWYAIMFFSGLLISFLMAGLIHLWIMLFGGKEEYEKTYQIYAYSKTPSFLFGWIPFFSVLAEAYHVVLLIAGTHKIQGIERNRAIWMFAVPYLIYIAVSIIFLMQFMNSDAMSVFLTNSTI